MASRRLPTVLLLGTMVATMTLAAIGAPRPQPRSSCKRKCGSVEILYPFGIWQGSDDDCAMPGFYLTCNDTGGSVYKPFYANFEVLNISFQNGQARMLNLISSACFNKTTKVMDYKDWELNFTHSPYSLSDTSNMFTVIGCHAVAYILDDNSENSGGYISGCMATCPRGNVSSLKNGSCSGIGCCQTDIPNGLKYYYVWFDDKFDFNMKAIYNVSPCNFAVLMDASEFTFLTSYMTSLDFNKTHDGQAPLVVDWAIGNKNCEAARKERDTYACVSSNSECFNSSGGKGYICNCSKGFQGNPYLDDLELGCTDIDECRSNPCSVNAKCYNTPGRFQCYCPRKYPKSTPTNGAFEPDNKLSFGVAVGLSLGIGIILLSLCLIFLIRKWRRYIEKQIRKKHFSKNQGLLLEQLIASDQNASDNTRIFSYEELQKATNNFDATRMLGSGGHGSVYKGILSNQRVVAIKRSNVTEEGEINQFINEVAILSQISHRNIVKLFGCCLETGVPLLVYDFVPNGSLFEAIHIDPSRQCVLSWEDCLRIAADAAGALHYLHSAASISIFHRDVKSSNILLDASYVAKVSDFGASRSIPIDQTHIVTNVQGTYGYLDPEYYHTGQLNEKSDVYSFGVVLLEMLLRKKPIFLCELGFRRNLSNYFLEEIKRRQVKDIVAAQVLEEATESEINSVGALAESCLRIQGEERPSMKQVEMALQTVRTQRLRSCPAAPIKDEEIDSLLSGRPINNIQALAISMSSSADLSSSACYSVEREFISSVSLPR